VTGRARVANSQVTTSGAVAALSGLADGRVAEHTMTRRSRKIPATPTPKVITDEGMPPRYAVIDALREFCDCADDRLPLQF